MELEISPFGKNLQDFEKYCEMATAECRLQGMDGQWHDFECELEVTLLNPNEQDINAEEDWELGKQYFRVKTAEAIGQA